jgi:hypothetical protein
MNRSNFMSFVLGLMGIVTNLIVFCSWCFAQGEHLTLSQLITWFLMFIVPALIEIVALVKRIWILLIVAAIWSLPISLYLFIASENALKMAAVSFLFYILSYFTSKPKNRSDSSKKPPFI